MYKFVQFRNLMKGNIFFTSALYDISKLLNVRYALVNEVASLFK